MFDKLYGIDKLEADIGKFKQDIENAKSSYITEYEEYVNIATGFVNTVEKYDFLNKQAEPFQRLYPEDTSGNSKLTDAVKGMGYTVTALELAAGGMWLAKKFYVWRLTKAIAKLDKLDDVILTLAKAGKAADKLEDIPKLLNAARLARGAKLANTAKIAKIARVAKVVAVVGAILGIVTLALDIVETDKRRDYLRNYRGEIEGHLKNLNGYIAETNTETNAIIEAFSLYFNEFQINLTGVFNTKKDGFIVNQDGTTSKQAYEAAMVKLRGALNEGIQNMGKLNGKTEIAVELIKALIDGDTTHPTAELLLETRGSEVRQGKKLIDAVVKQTKLSEERVQRLYVIELQGRNKPVEEVIKESGLSSDIVRQIYARRYLDAGKTVKETVDLSKLTEDQVRRVYASQLLDDELSKENADNVLDIKPIATKAGLTVEVVREIRSAKLKDLK